jgi:hypothetical protein
MLSDGEDFKLISSHKVADFIVKNIELLNEIIKNEK